MIRDVLLLHHSHTDIGYTHYQDTVFALHREYIRRAMDLAETYADGQAGEQFKWTCETTVVVEDFLRHARPEEVDRLVLLSRRRLIGFGGMYSNGTPLYSTEMLARTLYTAGRLRREYGLDIRYGLNCDVNGQSWGLVEMLLDAGFQGFAMAINRCMARDPQPRPHGFWWQGPSGRRLLAWNGEGYGYGQFLGIPRIPPDSGRDLRGWAYDPDRAQGLVHAYIDQLLQKGYPYDFVYLQVTSTFLWDNGGPHEELAHFVRDWNSRGWEPCMRIVTLDELFERIRQQPNETLPTHVGEWTDWWAQGVGSSAFETSLARESQARFYAAEGLASLLQGMPQPSAYSVDEDQQAWYSLALFGEHTWGGGDSINHPDSPHARGQWHRKATYAYEGAAAVTRLVQSAQRDLASRLSQNDLLRVQVYNPLPWSRDVPLYLPRVSRSGWEHAQLELDLELASAQGPVTTNMDYGVVTLPPCGYVTVPIRQEQETSNRQEYPANPEVPLFTPSVAPGLLPTKGVSHHSWRLENRFYHLTVDAATGAIRSLVNKASGHEWVDTSTPWRLGHYVYEEVRSPRQRNDMELQNHPSLPDYDHQPDLALARRGPEEVLEQHFLAGVGNGRLCLRMRAPGVSDLRMQVILYDDLPWIDLIFDLHKLAITRPESVYLAFPFRMNQPIAHYEGAGAIVQAEAEQIPNSCRDFYAIQNWVDLSDRERGVIVASPDAPLLHLGGFSNHKYQAHLQMEQPNLVGWPINNHWFTNFCLTQSGWMRFRYRLLTHESPFDPVAATRFGAEAAMEPLIGPVWDRPAGLEHRTASAPIHLPEQASFLSIDPNHTHLVGLKPAADERGIIVRVQEIAGLPTDFSLRFPYAHISAAEVCNLLEERADGSPPMTTEHEVHGFIEAYRLQTLRVIFTDQ